MHTKRSIKVIAPLWIGIFFLYCGHVKTGLFFLFLFALFTAIYGIWLKMARGKPRQHFDSQNYTATTRRDYEKIEGTKRKLLK